MAVGVGQVVSWYVCTFFAIIFAGLRQFHQWRRFGTVTLEDGFIILATCCLVGDLIIQQYMWSRGMADMANATHDDFVAIMKMIVPGSLLYVTSLWAVKLALTLLYKKIAPRGSKLQIVYNVMLGLLITNWLVLFFDIIFQCFPHDKRWSDDPNYQCDQNAADANYWITILSSIISDVIIICLPISMVSQLQMKLKQKLGVIGMFALGIFVVISGIIRAFYSKKNETMLTCTVSMVETAIAIVAASLPALRSLILGRVTQVRASSYAKYDLSGPNQRTNRSRVSRVTTNIVGGTNVGDNESEIELVKETGSAVPGKAPGQAPPQPGRTVTLEAKIGTGITVNTTFQVKREEDRPDLETV